MEDAESAKVAVKAEEVVHASDYNGIETCQRWYDSREGRKRKRNL